MYRESDRPSIGGNLSGDDKWQDWPPETSSARLEGEPGTGSSQLAEAPPTKGNRSPVSYYRSPDPKELPAPARRSVTDTPVDAANSDAAKPRGRAAKITALVLGGL